MTREQAESELMQIYMSLSEEKKKALDVAFKAMEQAIPEMYYPQVDGITPTVVAQADGEKVFKMRDATPEEQEAIDKYIKSISKPTGVNVFDFYEDEEQEQIDFVQPKKKIPCTIKVQADGEYISREAVIDCFKKWQPYMATRLWDFEKELSALPSVKPQEPIGHCKDCKYFEYDSVAKVDGIPLIVAHEICNKWGDGCRTKEDGYCFLFEPQERSKE